MTPIVAIEGAEFGNPRKKVNAMFNYKDTNYIIPITDPIFEQKYIHLDEGIYEMPESINRVILCLSIGKEYKGYIYKFVAGVMTL